MEIDWNKAPEGATHHHAQTQTTSEHWRKDGFFCNVGFETDGWQTEHFPLPLSRYTTRKEEWTGDGLPPVGTVCEYNDMQPTAFVPYDLKWSQVRIVARDKQGEHFFAVFSSVSGYHGNHRPECFRPIRTAEQIAAEERKSGIELFIADLRKVKGCGFYSHAEDLWDMGYRKQVQP